MNMLNVRAQKRNNICARWGFLFATPPEKVDSWPKAGQGSGGSTKYSLKAGQGSRGIKQIFP